MYIKGSRLSVVDNSGIRKVEIIGIYGRKKKVGTGDIVRVAVKMVDKSYKGDKKERKKPIRVIIVKQAYNANVNNILRQRFVGDCKGAAIVVDDAGNPKGSSFKGTVSLLNKKHIGNKFSGGMR